MLGNGRTDVNVTHRTRLTVRQGSPVRRNNATVCRVLPGQETAGTGTNDNECEGPDAEPCNGRATKTPHRKQRNTKARHDGA